MHNVILEDDGVHSIAEKLKSIRMTLEQNFRDEHGPDRKTDALDHRKKKRKIINKTSIKDVVNVPRAS